MANEPVVLSTTSSFGRCAPQAVDAVREAGFVLVGNPHGRKLTEDELLELVVTNRPVGLLAGTEPVTAKVLESGRPELRAVSRVGVGWDNVDHEAADRLGILVSRTEGVLDQCVAELALGMMLCALRHIATGDRCIRTGNWEKRMGGLLAGRTVGILGFGAIGRRVGELVRAVGAEVVFTDLAPADVDWAERLSMDGLLEQADILTIHASGGGRIIGREQLERFAKPGAIIVNTARGGMIDENALAQCLRDGRIACACLDVFEKEPYAGPLAALDGAVLTPHIGSYAAEARAAMESAAVDNLLEALSR